MPQCLSFFDIDKKTGLKACLATVLVHFTKEAFRFIFVV